MASLKPQKSDVPDTMAAFEQIFAVFNRRLQSLEDSDKAKDDCIKDLQRKNKDLERKLRKVEETAARRTSIDFAISALEAKSKSLTNNLEKVQKSNRQQKTSLQELNQKMNPLCTEISRLTNLQRLLNQLYTKVTDKNEPSQEVTILQDKLSSVERLVRTNNMDLASLSGRIDTMTQDLRVLKERKDVKSYKGVCFQAEKVFEPIKQLSLPGIWYKLNEPCKTNRVSSPYLNANTSTFTAPVSGIYAFYVELKQCGDGELQAGLLVGYTFSYYFGRTFRDKHLQCGLSLCNLKLGDTVSVTVCRHSGCANVHLYSFSGWLIEET